MYTTFYATYLKLCSAMGQSPSAVALKIGTSKAAATGWKNGSLPTDSTKLKLATYFGVEPSVFDTGLVEEQKEKAPTVVLGESFTVDEIIEAYEMAPARVKAAIRSLLGL